MADVKISALADVVTLAAGDLFAIDDVSAAATKSATATEIAAFINTDSVLTGNPTAPTAAADDNDTSVATTAYVIGQSATQAELETGTSTTKFVSAGRAQFHASAAKCWGATTGGGTPSLTAGSYNVTSIADTAVGRMTVTIGTDFSSANFVGVVCGTAVTATLKLYGLVTKAAGTVTLESGTAATTLADVGVGFDWAFYGDQ